MIPPLWYAIGAIVFTMAVFMAGMKAGSAIEGQDCLAKEATQKDKIITIQQTVIKEVPKIVTRTVTVTQTKEREVERVVTKIPDLLSPDCIMPRWYGELLVAAANGVDPSTPGNLDPYTGEYGCREVLKATLSDLKAGWKNTTTLEGLEGWIGILTSKGDKQ